MLYKGLVMLKPVSPDDLGNRAKAAINKFLRHDLSQRTYEDVIDNARSGYAAIFTWDTLFGTGVIFCAVVGRGKKRELYLDIVSGTGYFKLVSLIMEDLETIAKQNGCETIGATSGRKGLVDFMKNKCNWQVQGVYGNYAVGEVNGQE